MRGNGYWLNPLSKRWTLVTRHELAMRNAAQMAELGVDAQVIERAQQITPFSPEGEDALRLLGIRSGLIRVRDQGSYVSIQFDAPPSDEASLLRFVWDFMEREDLWRPYVRVGNFRTPSETTYTWEELSQRLAQSAAADAS